MLWSEASNPQHQKLREGQELLPLCAAQAQKLLLLPLCYYQCTQHHLIMAADLNQQAEIYCHLFLSNWDSFLPDYLNKFCAQLRFATGSKEVKVAVSIGYEMTCYLAARG